MGIIINLQIIINNSKLVYLFINYNISQRDIPRLFTDIYGIHHLNYSVILGLYSIVYYYT